MRKLFVVMAVLVFCLSAPALADLSTWYSTYGYSGLSYVVRDYNEQVAGHGLNWYRAVEFTLYNNSDHSAPYMDFSNPQRPYVTLADALQFEFVNRQVAFAEAPNSEWTWNVTNLYFERYSADPMQKYWAPPAVEPGGSLSGFMTYFQVGGVGSSFTMPAFYAATHLLSVAPDSETTHPPVPAKRYTATDIWISETAICEISDWWDDPTDDGGGEPSEVVPEASTVLLAALGMVAPVGYLRLRRRIK